VTVTDGDSNQASDTHDITVQEAVAITAQPTASQGIEPGATASLSVTATGTSPAYQWYEGASGDTSSPLVGETGASLTTPALSASTSYWCRVSNQVSQVDSTAGTVTINVSITQQPADAAINTGQQAVLTIDYLGDPVSVQWYQGLSGDTSTPLAGETGDSLTVSPTVDTNYWARISNANDSEDSVTAAVTINVAPSITAEPSDETISDGNTATLSLTATGTVPLSYQWYTGSSGDTSSPISGATSASYTTPTLTEGTYTYWCRVTNVAGSADSVTATVTVTALSSLLTDLVAYWKLDEGSGTRIDSHGSNNLTDNNSVGSATGKIGNAAEFSGSNSLGAGTSLQPAGDFTFSCWLNPDTLNGNAVAANWTNASNRTWAIDTFSGTLRFYIYGPSIDAIIDTGITLSTVSWSLVIAWFDDAADNIYCQINNGTIFSASFTGPPYQAGEFTLGKRASLFNDGLMDEVGLWSRVLTAAERNELYNAGAGITYPF
jgi:hypothetical protein